MPMFFAHRPSLGDAQAGQLGRPEQDSLGAAPVAVGGAGTATDGARRRRSPHQVPRLGCTGQWPVPARARGPGAGSAWPK